MSNTRFIRWSGLIGSGTILVLLGLFAWAWLQISDALPLLDGEVHVAGITAPAQLHRDAQGTAIIQAANEIDANRALGFAHGQDRFFQMDLLRRSAAGELSALVGSVAIDVDRAAVIHRFRELSRQVLARESPPRRALIEAYTTGVNAGINSLPSKPWEYALLRTEPSPWLPEDSGLVFYSMVLDLQDSTGTYEQTLANLRDFLGPTAVDYFNPLIGPDDSALDGTQAALPPPPPPRVLDLRQAPPRTQVLSDAAPPDPLTIGSNAFVHIHDSVATLAGDPHLTLRVPNLWYRARLEWPLPDASTHHVTGATLPGLPGVIIGSNGHISWSFTNARVDTGDLVALDLDPIAFEYLYLHNKEAFEFETHVDMIEVKGDDAVKMESTWTHFGPLVGVSRSGKKLAYRWTFHDPAAINFNLLDLNTARTVAEALFIGTHSGMPTQNLFVADTTGDAAWTLTGQIPQRRGFDGHLPVSWAYGDRSWEGFQSPADHPVVRATATSPIWSGNQRLIGGEAMKRLGDSGFDDPERATQIKRDLLDLPPTAIKPADLLAIQLDHRADWVMRWRDLLVATLDRTELSGDRAKFREFIATWDGQADAKSVGYRLLRDWRSQLSALTLQPIFAQIIDYDPDFAYWRLRYEPSLWALHRDEPINLLSADYADWDALRLTAVDRVLAALADKKTSLERATWGSANRLRFQHPLAGALPDFMANWFNFPAVHQSGDSRTPHVARPSHGASLRMVVSPGRESEGIYHQPGGASGNPLSPYYRTGHEDWVRGKPSPFLPGAPQHTLNLLP
jgi:penicillin amidase